MGKRTNEEDIIIIIRNYFSMLVVRIIMEAKLRASHCVRQIF